MIHMSTRPSHHSRPAPVFGLLLSAALAGVLVASPVLANDVSKVNGSITAEAGQTYGDLDTVNGSIRLQDQARTGNVETVNGSVRAGDGIQSRNLGTVNGSIRIGTDARVQGNVETVNGSIFIDNKGTVDGNVKTVSGSIGLVGVTLSGSIATVNGDIPAGAGTHVGGVARVGKPATNWFPVVVGKRLPRVIIGPGSSVDGELVFEREVLLYVHDSARIGKVTGATPTPYSGARAPSN